MCHLTHKLVHMHPRYWWRSQKVEKYVMKTGYFQLSVGNIDHLSCLKRRERPDESRLRHQYRGCVRAKLWYFRHYAVFWPERRCKVLRYDEWGISRTTLSSKSRKSTLPAGKPKIVHHVF